MTIPRARQGALRGRCGVRAARVDRPRRGRPDRARAAARPRPRAPLPRGLARGRGDVHAHPRRDQLRLGLVPDAAQAARAAPATTRSRGAWPSGSARPGRGRPTSCAHIDAADVADVLGQDRRPRADGPVRRRAALARRVPRRAAASLELRRTARPCGSRRRWPRACRSSTTPASGSARRSPPNDLALAGRRRVRRPRRAHDLRRQPRAARAARGRRARLRRRRSPTTSTAASCCRPGPRRREIRACAVHACVQIARELGVPERTLDTWLWDRGQEPRYKALPRHRTRTVYY